LAPNAAAVRELEVKLAEAARVPAALPVADLPAMAHTISGAVYKFPRNASRIDELSLVFSDNKEAQLKLKYLGTDLTIPVGLDGVYRLGPHGPFKLPAGATGKWTSDSDFELDLNFISNINRYSAVLHFEGDAVQVSISESSGLIRDGHLVGKKAWWDDEPSTGLGSEALGLDLLRMRLRPEAKDAIVFLVIRLVVLLFVAAFGASAAADPFLGTWKANPVKTRLSPGTPEVRKSETMLIDDMGIDRYRVTRITSDGKSSSVGLSFDRKERFSDPTTTVVGVRVGPRHFRNTIKSPKGTLVSEWIASPDGKVLTNKRKGSGTESGRAIDEVLVYDRQPEKWAT
jgi:hypothetical protein